MAGELADAAVTITANLDEFEPQLRRALVAAVQRAADQAERQFRRAGARSGRTFAVFANQAARGAIDFQPVGERASRSFEAGLLNGFSGAISRAADAAVTDLVDADWDTAGELSGESFSDGLRRGVSGTAQDVAADAANDLSGRARPQFETAGSEAGESFGAGVRRTARRASGNAGGEAGGFFARAFSRASERALGTGLISGFGALVAAIVTSATPLSTVFAGGAAALVALTAAIAQASGAAVAFGGVLGGIGLGVAAVKVGTQGLSDAFDAQSDALKELAATGAVTEATQKKLDAAMKSLAPSARAVVLAVGAQAGAWTRLRTAVQESLFAGVGAQISQLAGTFLPLLQAQLTTAATSVNRFITSFAGFLRAPATVQRLSAILTGLNGILATLLPTIQPLVQGFLVLFQASLPFAQQLAAAIARVGASFQGWAEGIVASGQFAEFMRGAFAAAQSLLGILGNLGSILGSVFGAGAATGGGLLQLIERLTQSLADFLNSSVGQTALESFFGLISQAASIVLSIFRSLAPAVQGLGAIFEALQGPLQALGTALGPVIQQLFVTLGDAFTQLAPSLAALVTGLTPLATELGGALVGIFQALLTAVLPLAPAIVQIVTAVATGLVPIIAQLVPIITLVADAFGQIILAVLPLVPQLLLLVPPLAEFGLAATQLLVALTPLIVELLPLFVQTLSDLTPVLIALTPIIIQVIGVFTDWTLAMARVITFVALLLARAQIAFTGIARAAVSLQTTVIGAFTALVAGVLAVMRTITAPLVAIVTTLARLIINGVRSGLSTLSDVFARPFEAARSAVSSALEGIIDVVAGAVDRITGLVGQISGAIGRISGFNFPSIDIPGFANGGLVSSPTLAMVGEAGPEVVIPLTRPKRRDELLDRYFGGGPSTGPAATAPVYQVAGTKTREIHMPVHVSGVSADDVVDLLERRLQRYGLPARGIDTAGGKR